MEVVQREYFDAEVATHVATSLRERLAGGRYAGAASLQSLADSLTRDLVALTRDKHLNVTVVRDRTSGSTTDEVAVEDARAIRGRRTNFAVQRVEILPGNVGYMNITGFFRPNEARHALSTAMRMLQHTDALILDVRTNSGGNPGTVALLAGYLFNEPGLPLFEIVPRHGAATQYSTEESLPA